MHFVASVTDVESRWRPLSSEESDIARVLLNDADLKLFSARPMLVDAIASTDPALHVDPELAEIALCDMVIRVLQNPDSFRTTTIGADGSIAVGYYQPLETLRPRVALAPGDLDEIDRALRTTGQGYPIIKSRRMRNVDYGIATVNMNALPTP